MRYVVLFCTFLLMQNLVNCQFDDNDIIRYGPIANQIVQQISQYIGYISAGLLMAWNTFKPYRNSRDGVQFLYASIANVNDYAELNVRNTTVLKTSIFKDTKGMTIVIPDMVVCSNNDSPYGEENISWEYLPDSDNNMWVTQVFANRNVMKSLIRETDESHVLGRIVRDFVYDLTTRDQTSDYNINLIGEGKGALVAGLASWRSDRVSRLTLLGSCDTIRYGISNESLKNFKRASMFASAIYTGNPTFERDCVIKSLQVSFFPNGGGRQPGCTEMTDLSGCSRRRAMELLAEAIKNPTAFPAVKCENYEAFKKGQCEESKNVVYLGPNVDTSLKGNYYFETNANPPYGLGRVHKNEWK